MQVEECPTEERVAQALFSYSGDIFNGYDAKRFLEINEIDKPNSVRFICWLISARVVPPERLQWMPNIMKELQYYHKCTERYLGTSYLTPINDLRPNARIAIQDSFDKSEKWFLQFCDSQDIGPSHLENVKTRLQRIAAILTYDSNGFELKEGYDYFISICYIICLSFQIKSGLSPFFGEALAYSLSRNFLGVINFTRHLDEINANQDHYDELHKMCNHFCPKAIKQLRQAGKDILDLSLGWEKMLLVEQHSPYNLLMIWDHILIRLDDIRLYFRFLDVAHLKAMEEAEVNFADDKEIYDMLWDATTILEYADTIEQEDEHSIWENILPSICPCYPFLSIFGFGKLHF